jgi:hypothetical protein
MLLFLAALAAKLSRFKVERPALKLYLRDPDVKPRMQKLSHTRSTYICAASMDAQRHFSVDWLVAVPVASRA